MSWLLGKNLVEASDGRFGLFLMQQADSHPQLRLFALRIDFKRLLERFGGCLPAAQLFVTDAQVEVCGRVARRQGEQLLIGLDGIVVLFQLELDVSLGGENFSRLFATLDGGVKLAERVLAV